MAYAWIQDVPINADIYGEIVARLAKEPPPGLVVHIAQVMEDGHVRYLDVWESQEACERFTEERLHPVVGLALAHHQIRPDHEPPRVPVHLIDVWVGSARVSRPSNAAP